jgi:hypothetical protein
VALRRRRQQHLPLTDAVPTTAGRDDREPTAAPAGSHDPAGAASRRPEPSTPYLLLAGIVALLVPVAAAAGPLRDIDLFWHLRLGQELLAGTPVPDAGRGWSFAPVPDTWISSQWLFELLLARIEQAGGLAALALVRVVTAVATLAVLASVTLRHRPVRAGVWPFLLGALALTVVTQERSQQVTLILAPLVGWWAERLWREGRLPRWWVVLPLVVVWSNAHGGWALLPLLLVLAVVARTVDHGLRDRAVGTGLLLVAGSMLAACVSPSGVDNALAPLRFASSTVAIVEWQPVTVRDAVAAPLLVALLVIVLCWARGRERPSRGELVLVLAIAGFGLVSARNVAPATLALAPLLTGILARALGEPDPAPAGTRAPFARLALGLGAVGAVLGVLLAPMQSPVVDPSVPQNLLAVLRDAPGDQRVLNGYNVSGPVLWFSGPSPAVRVGIDGRADRYGADYISAYLDLVAARPGWSTLLDELAPTSALLRDSDALTEVLVAQRGWVEVGRESGWVLLRPPGSTGWPAP